jgi:hypothetical protein
VPDSSPIEYVADGSSSAADWARVVATAPTRKNWASELGSAAIRILADGWAEHIFSDAAVAGLTADLLVYLRMPGIRGAPLH